MNHEDQPDQTKEAKGVINRLFASRAKLEVLKWNFEALGDNGMPPEDEEIDFTSFAYGVSAICGEVIDTILDAELIINNIKQKGVTT